MNRHNCSRLSRVYPKGARVDSSNFDPQPMWNAGMQLVALNSQTADRGMWLHHGFFLQNGRCGLVQKPAAMFEKGFSPYAGAKFKRSEAITVKIRILSGRGLSTKTGKGAPSPAVTMEISGVDIDTPQTFRSACVDGNGLNPSWDEEAEFEVVMPQLATLGIVVHDMDMFGEPQPIAQRYLPIGSKHKLGLRPGWRSIPLWNLHSKPILGASLLVYVTIELGIGKKRQQLLADKTTLEAELKRVQEQMAKEAKAGRASGALGREKRELEEKLEALNAKING